MSIKEKFFKWFWFTFKNPVVRKGESGGFKWEFRQFWLTVETVSGNFKAKFMADEHPYAYLLAGKTDDNIIGFCQIVYMLSHTLTTDQVLVNDVQRVYQKYNKRLQKQAASEVKEDETEEKIALETEKQMQEIVEMPKKERRKVERDINGRFKKAVAQSLKEKEEKQ